MRYANYPENDDDEQLADGHYDDDGTYTPFIEDHMNTEDDGEDEHLQNGHYDDDGTYTPFAEGHLNTEHDEQDENLPNGHYDADGNFTPLKGPLDYALEHNPDLHLPNGHYDSQGHYTAPEQYHYANPGGEDVDTNVHPTDLDDAANHPIGDAVEPYLDHPPEDGNGAEHSLAHGNGHADLGGTLDPNNFYDGNNLIASGEPSRAHTAQGTTEHDKPEPINIFDGATHNLIAQGEPSAHADDTKDQTPVDNNAPGVGQPKDPNIISRGSVNDGGPVDRNPPEVQSRGSVNDGGPIDTNATEVHPRGSVNDVPNLPRQPDDGHSGPGFEGRGSVNDGGPVTAPANTAASTHESDKGRGSVNEGDPPDQGSGPKFEGRGSVNDGGPVAATGNTAASTLESDRGRGSVNDGGPPAPTDVSVETPGQGPPAAKA